jgi:type III secretion system FlhB-like substrate exporter
MKAPLEAVALEYGKQKTPRVVAKGHRLAFLTEQPIGVHHGNAFQYGAT